MAVERLSQASILTLQKYNSMIAGYSASGDYELIASTVLGSNTSSVTFTGLGTSAAAYKHLQLRIVAKHSADQNAIMQLNSDTGANYWWHQMQGNGSSGSAYGTSASWMQIGYGPNSSTIPTVSIIDILDFKLTTKNTTIRTFTGCAYSSTWNVKLMSGYWANTAAVTSISMNEVSGAYQIGSRFSLYGLRG